MSQLSGWLEMYLGRQREVCDSLPIAQIEGIIALLRDAQSRGANIFVFGNGGSAANASHFATDLGKGASDVSPSPGSASSR